jgi:hypothetical protein
MCINYEKSGVNYAPNCLNTVCGKSHADKAYVCFAFRIICLK